VWSFLPASYHEFKGLIVWVMELRALKYLVTVAEEGNMSRAAARLFISQPAVSRQIKDLEEAWGVTLFLRKSNGMELTPAGEFACSQAKNILARALDLERSMKGMSLENEKSLCIGYIPTALPGFLSQVLRRFYDRFPEVKLDIQEMHPQDQVSALKSDQLDLALLGTACDSLKDSFEVEHLAKVALCVALPDHHLLSLRKSLEIKELVGEKWITLDEKLFPGRTELLHELEIAAAQKLTILSKARGLSEILGRVASGSGIAVVPQDVSQLPHPNVVFIPLAKPRIYLYQSAVWRKDAESAEFLNLLDLLRESGATYLDSVASREKT
jgi:DNA-binding transcriptional LysR family regulator